MTTWAAGGTSLSFDAWEDHEGSRNAHVTQGRPGQRERWEFQPLLPSVHTALNKPHSANQNGLPSVPFQSCGTSGKCSQRRAELGALHKQSRAMTQADHGTELQMRGWGQKSGVPAEYSILHSTGI